MEPAHRHLRHNVVLADIAVIRALGAAHSRQAADLDAVAARLRSAAGPACVAAFGPVGAGFLAALADAVARDAGVVAQLSERVGVAAETVEASAAAYQNTEDRAGRSITAIGT